MTLDAHVAIQSELVPGEHLLWCGRPSIRFRPGEVAGSVVAVVAAFLVAPAARHGGIAALVAVGFATGALWGLVLRPWDRAKLAYGVTDQRVLIVHRGWRRTPKAYALSSMSPANIVPVRTRWGMPTSPKGADTTTRTSACRSWWGCRTLGTSLA